MSDNDNKKDSGYDVPARGRERIRGVDTDWQVGDKVFDNDARNLRVGKNPGGVTVEIIKGKDLLDMPNSQFDSLNMDPTTKHIAQWERYYQRNPDKRPTGGDPNFYPIEGPPDEQGRSGTQQVAGNAPDARMPNKRAGSRDPGLKSETQITPLSDAELRQLRDLKAKIAKGEIKPGEENAEVRSAQNMLESHGYKLDRHGADGKFGEETGGTIGKAIGKNQHNSPGFQNRPATGFSPTKMS